MALCAQAQQLGYELGGVVVMLRALDHKPPQLVPNCAQDPVSPMIASDKIAAGRTNPGWSSAAHDLPLRRLVIGPDLVGPQLRPGPRDHGHELARYLRQGLVVMELGA